MKFELSTKEHSMLKVILNTVNVNVLEEICSNDNADLDTFNSICRKVFHPLDKFMETKGFSPETSDGGCMRYVKETRGGLTVAITDNDGIHLPEMMEEPVLVGLIDKGGDLIVETEYTSLNEFFDRTNFL